MYRCCLCTSLMLGDTEHAKGECLMLSHQLLECGNCYLPVAWCIKHFGLSVFPARQQANIDRHCKGSSGPSQVRLKLLCMERLLATSFLFFSGYCRQLQQSIIHKLHRYVCTACLILVPCLIKALRANIVKKPDLRLVASQFCL